MGRVSPSLSPPPIFVPFLIVGKKFPSIPIPGGDLIPDGILTAKVEPLRGKGGQLTPQLFWRKIICENF